MTFNTRDFPPDSVKPFDLEVVHPDDFQAMLRALRAHLDGFAPHYEMQFRLRGNGFGYRTVLSRGRVVARDHRGDATRMVGTMIDLTGRPLAPTGSTSTGPAVGRWLRTW